MPDDPVLAEVAAAFNDAGYWATIFDERWRTLYITEALRLARGGLRELAPFPLGVYVFGPESLTARLEAGMWTLEDTREAFEGLGPYLLAAAEGGREELRELVDPRVRDLVDQLSPAARLHAFTAWGSAMYRSGGGQVMAPATLIPVRDSDGRLAGTVILTKPAASMAVLGRIAAAGDLRHFERMQQVAKPGRRPAAVLFADLESSAPLARRLSTASYFALGRRITRAADQCVIDTGGLVGRHVGDGVVAFFLAESAGCESAAARACIQAARAIKEALIDVAKRCELAPERLVMRFGLHWGARLYVGQITTSGRSEVTALGDEVNEGARIEACATGGRTLASKELLERLDREDAAALDLDPDHIGYTPLAELPAATEKARRDAPAIAVCEV